MPRSEQNHASQVDACHSANCEAEMMSHEMCSFLSSQDAIKSPDNNPGGFDGSRGLVCRGPAENQKVISPISCVSFLFLYQVII